MNVKKSFPSLKAHKAALMSVLSALNQTPAYTARPQIRASALHGVPVYTPAVAGTRYIYPPRDGQAELTWVAGSVPSYIQGLTGPSVE